MDKKIIAFLALALLYPVLLVSQVTGRVTSSEDGLPIFGVTVVAHHFGYAASTDEDGRFNIKSGLSQENLDKDTLIFKFTGFETQRVPIRGQYVIDVIMNPEYKVLREAVVTAIGIKKEKKRLAYSATEVSADEIQKSNEVNIVNALNGKVAGVQITSSSGTPGASSSMIIRGYSSIDGSNQPLFIIDGVPIDNSYRGSNFTDQGNRALDLNPNDIENISVLKGGAATALYGYRAGNGVVMITTKKGKEGKSEVTFSSSTLFDRVNRLPIRQGRWAQGAGGVSAEGSQFSWGGPITGENFADQPFDFFQTGVTLNNNISISGGNGFNSYYLSLGNTRQSGIVPNTGLNRTNVQFSGSHMLWGKVKISSMINYTSSNAQRGQRGSNLSGVMLGLMRGPSSYDLTNGSDDPADDEASYLNPDGTQRTYFANYDNPYWSVNKNINDNEVDRLIGAFEVMIPINQYFSILNRTGVDWYSDRIRESWDKRSNEFKDLGGRMFVNDVVFNSLNNDFMLNYQREWGSKWEVSAILGHNYYDVEETSYSMDGVGFVIDDYYDISNVSALNVISDDFISRQRTVGAYGNVNIGFRKMLYVDFTARNDWFSTLPKENNSVFYPSVSTAFVFSEVIPAIKKKAFGKLRASYSETGNGAPGAFLTDSYFQQSGQPQGQLGFSPTSFVFNPDLRPERLKSIELGLDMRFFMNRLGLDFTYYNNNSVDQIIYLPVPVSSGYLETVFNAGNIRNQGVELLITADVIERKVERAWSYSTSLNFTRNVNKVESLGEGVDLIALPSFGLASTQSVVAVGQQYGVLYGGVWERDGNGNILIDENGYPVKSAERGFLGNPNPDFLMGWRNDIRYKNFTLSFLWDIRVGGYIHNGTKAVMLFHGTHEDTENRDTETTVWEGVLADGSTNTTEIRLDESFYNRYSLQYVSEEVMEEVNWLRLRDLSISYELPRKVRNKLKMSSCVVSLTSRNLLLFTNYTGIDPETNLSGASNSIGRDYFNMPNTRSIGFSVRVGF